MMRAKKNRYLVEVAYLDIESDEIQQDYIDTLAYSADNAYISVKEYLMGFPNITHVKVISVDRL